MLDENYLLREFNDAFKDGITDYVLLKSPNEGYIILNISEGSMMILEIREMGDFFVNRLLELGVSVYSDHNDIPGWRSKKRSIPPEMHPSLRELINKWSSIDKNK